MGNHYHLLLETPQGNLARAMRQLNGIYTQTFNRRHQRVGHLFQGRYNAILIQRNAHLLEVARYIVLNPVRAGLATAPQDWEWSSYRATAGMGEVPPCLRLRWLLEQFHVDMAVAMGKYREFVRDGVSCGFPADVKAGITYGGREFVKMCGERAQTAVGRNEVPRSQRYVGRPELCSILGGPGSKLEKVISAVGKYGYTQKAVADELGVHYSSVSKLLARGMSRFKT
jgi:hypothetical protein